MADENECSWNRRRVWWNHFSGSLYLPSFYRMAEFLCGELYLHWQKWEKTIPCLSMFFTMLQALSRCFKGRHCLQWDTDNGMMFVFASPWVLVAVYVNCLKIIFCDAISLEPFENIPVVDKKCLLSK